MMEILNLVQGTDEWLAARLEHFTASEAPAMMDQSKFMSRNQLLAVKKGWKANPVDHFKQQLFDKGHEHEDQARPFTEMQELIDFPPAVGRIVLADLELLASFDGLNEDGEIWEHKDWNETLAENVRNGILEPQYYWQLEHQMLVAGKQTVLFTVSNGTLAKRVSMIYASDPDRRDELILGWTQFGKDLEAYQLQALSETVEAATNQLPTITYMVQGTTIVSNIKEYLPLIRHRAEEESNLVLESDQDFADKEAFNKTTKEARGKLKQIVADVRAEFVSFSEFADTAQTIDGILQKMQSQGEKQVKLDKDRKKEAILKAIELDYQTAIRDASNSVVGANLTQDMLTYADFQGAMRNKRTIDSLQNAVDSVLAEAKIEIDQVKARMIANSTAFNQVAKDHLFLFADKQDIINSDPEAFMAIMKTRIMDHQQAEENRLAAERERIRKEEEDKARKKILDEQAAENARVAEEKRLEEQAKHNAEVAERAEAHRKETEERAEAERLAAKKPAKKSTKRKVAPTPIAEPDLQDLLMGWQEKYHVSPDAMVELAAIIENNNVKMRKTA